MSDTVKRYTTNAVVWSSADSTTEFVLAKAHDAAMAAKDAEIAELSNKLEADSLLKHEGYSVIEDAYFRNLHSHIATLERNVSTHENTIAELTSYQTEQTKIIRATEERELKQLNEIEKLRFKSQMTDATLVKVLRELEASKAAVRLCIEALEAIDNYEYSDGVSVEVAGHALTALRAALEKGQP